jgi:hypothetical protein
VAEITIQWKKVKKLTVQPFFPFLACLLASCIGSIAACVLQDKLTETLKEEIDKPVAFGGEQGFQVSFTDCSQLSVVVLTETKAQSRNLTQTLILCNNTLFKV